MENAIAALKDTPVPTILVVAGIVFLLLAVAGQLAGHIVVAPERQRWAAVIGGALLVIGIALHIAPQARMTSPMPERVQTPPSVTPPTSTTEPTVAGPVEPHRIKTEYLGGSTVEFSVFINSMTKFFVLDGLLR